MAEEENSVSDRGSNKDTTFSTPPNSESTTEVTKDEFIYFIWDKAEKYLPKFRRFNIDGVDKFAVTWHWPAFFFSFAWMAYRKMYLWAFGAGVIVFLYYMGLLLLRYLTSYLPFSVLEVLAHTILPFLQLIWLILPWIAFGIAGNYVYYKHAKKKIIECKARLPSSDAKEITIALQKTGGVNPWAAALAIAIMLLLGFL